MLHKLENHPLNNKFLLSFIMFFILTGPVLASVNLSVVPQDGTNDIRLKQGFAGLDLPKNVRVRVTSTNGNRYQVFQRVVEPLVNEKGDISDLSGLKTATEYNSNTAGTLYLNSPEPLSMGEQLLYTSGQGGDSDSFVVAYSTVPDRVTGNGNYFGKIVYTVRSTTEGSQDQQLLNLILESQNSWKVDVRGLKDPVRVSIKDSDTDPQLVDGIKVSFTGASGSSLRVYQETVVLPQDQQARELKPGVLKYLVTGSEQVLSGSAGQGRLFEHTRDQIYTGRAMSGDLIIKFLPDPDMVLLLDAGDYIGKLKYTVEADQSRQDFLIDFEMHVQPIFTMQVNMPPEGVSFRNVLATNPPEEHEITITVKTNLHKPYQLTQAFSSLLTNEKGKEIEKEHFLIKVQLPAGQKGKTKFAEFSPVEVGEYPVYASDGQGSPATFKVQYRLEGYSKMNSGNFLAPIRFSLDQN